MALPETRQQKQGLRFALPSMVDKKGRDIRENTVVGLISSYKQLEAILIVTSIHKSPRPVEIRQDRQAHNSDLQ